MNFDQNIQRIFFINAFLQDTTELFFFFFANFSFSKQRENNLHTYIQTRKERKKRKKDRKKESEFVHVVWICLCMFTKTKLPARKHNAGVFWNPSRIVPYHDWSTNTGIVCPHRGIMEALFWTFPHAIFFHHWRTGWTVIHLQRKNKNILDHCCFVCASTSRMTKAVGLCQVRSDWCRLERRFAQWSLLQSISSLTLTLLAVRTCVLKALVWLFVLQWRQDDELVFLSGGC